MAGKPILLAERFEKHFIPEPNSGCWLWLSATIKSKDSLYGVVGADKGDEQKMLLAHRASYRLYIGPLSRNMHVDHKCQNTLCVNPKHLQALTPKAHGKTTWRRILNGHCKRGHLMDEKNSWIEKTGQSHCRRCHADREAKNRANKSKRFMCKEVLN